MPKTPKPLQFQSLPLCHSRVYSTTAAPVITTSRLSSMAESESFLLDGGTTTTSFSQLLFSNDTDDDHVLGLGLGHSFRCSTSPADPHEKFPKMLCFGGGYDYDQNIEDEIVVFSETAAATTHQIPGPHVFLTCSDTSSSVSSANNNNNIIHTPNVANNTTSKSNRKRQGSSQKTGEVAKTPVASQNTSKKMKTLENPSPISYPKPRKEKIGDRVTTLQQLVSPFGKTDTASVLHEAMGYIRFLQDQVQVLCSPYLQYLPDGGEKDLRSRGLCLVPVDCTEHVASCNGADYWSPAAMEGTKFSSSSAAKN